MKRYWVSIVGGVLLVAGGVVALLQNLEVLVPGSGLLWAFLFGSGGVLFLTVYLTDRAEWWPLIPAGALLGLAGAIGLSVLDAESGALGGAVFFACTGLPFLVICLTNRDQWWAIIPSGSLITLALVAWLSWPLGGTAAGGIFFLGLAATFALLSLAGTPRGRFWWALIPAGVLALLGAVVLADTPRAIGYIAAGAMVLAGVWVVVRAVRGGRAA